MADRDFSAEPISTPRVETAYRRIHTTIPCPGTKEILAKLERFEARAMHGQLPIVWEHAHDFQIFDMAGNCWIDFTSGIFVTNSGHSNPKIVQALNHTISQGLLHSYTFATRIRADYLEKLVSSLPPPLEKAFLLSAGTEASDCLLKLMRLYAAKAGKSKPGVVVFDGAMHGRTVGATLMGGSPSSRGWVGFDDPNIHRLPFPYPWESDNLSGAKRAQRDIQALLEKGLSPGTDLCGILLESYQGWAAAFYPKDYVQEISAFAKANGILLAFDEIQSGFGRTGRFFAYQHYDVEPDLVLCGKGMSSSLPLSAVLGRAEIMDLPEIGSMSSTHSANPLSCAAGLANLQSLVDDDLVAQSARKGAILHARLEDFQRRFPRHVSHVLGNGLIAAILLSDPKTGQADNATATRVCEIALRRGLLLVHTGRESIKIGPPLTIADAALQEGIDVLLDALEDAFFS